ncbi:MAG: HAMP domain-containing histidine kinase [Clostridiales Family XIII bacterium]|jgi:signal transduction histidine kinase|nr:HAMP domain-containing histidine kinase [Clostridiales Family XIII bacterium]
MAKVKAIHLQHYYTRTVALTIVSVLAIIVVWMLLFNFALIVGVISPANAGETEAMAAITYMEQSGQFDLENTPEYYNFVYFGQDGTVLDTSLSTKKLEQAISTYGDKSGDYTSAKYLNFADGSYCLFTWNYSVTMKGAPDIPVEAMYIVFMILTMVLFFAVLVKNMSRRIKEQLSIIKKASNIISEHNLEQPVLESSKIKEFNEVLYAIEEMRQALSESLHSQWHAQERRKREIAALAHDLRTPITVITGNAELLLEDALNPDQNESAQQILSSGKRAEHYISMLQQVSDFDFSKEAPTEIEISALLDEIYQVAQPIASTKNIQIEMTNMAPKKIRVYANLLFRALQNIVMNAIQYTPEGGNVRIDAVSDHNRVTFTIKDEGKGFSDDALLHASEIFWSSDKSRTNHAHYGLGLSVAARVAELHSGQMILSNANHGGLVRLIIRTI